MGARYFSQIILFFGFRYFLQIILGWGSSIGKSLTAARVKLQQETGHRRPHLVSDGPSMPRWAGNALSSSTDEIQIQETPILDPCKSHHTMRIMYAWTQNNFLFVTFALKFNGCRFVLPHCLFLDNYLHWSSSVVDTDVYSISFSSKGALLWQNLQWFWVNICWNILKKATLAGRQEPTFDRSSKLQEPATGGDQWSSTEA